MTEKKQRAREKFAASIERTLGRYSPFGRYVRRRQGETGKHTEQLAKDVGLSSYHLREWLEGKWYADGSGRFPNPYYLERMGESLRVPFVTLARLAIHNVERECELPPVESDPHYRAVVAGLLYDLIFASAMPARDIEDILALAEERFGRLPEPEKRRVHKSVYWHQRHPLRKRLAEERRKEDQPNEPDKE